MKLSLAEKVVMCDQIFFVHIVVFHNGVEGSSKILRIIRDEIQNYLWSGKEQLTRTWMSWKECCMKKNKGGLRVVNPEAAKSNLLCKWVVKAMEPGESNLLYYVKISIC